MKKFDLINETISHFSDEIIAEADTKTLESHKITVVSRWYLFAPIAAACLIIAVAAVIVPIFKADSPVLDNSGFDLSNTDLIGLPAENFSVSDMKIDTKMCRMPLKELNDFLKTPNLQAFAFVRVLESELVDNNDSYPGKQQIATVQVLSEVWSKQDNSLPQVITVRQSIYGHGYSFSSLEHNNGVTNLLRDGGVYLLPVAYWQREDYWYIYGGSMDTLFEVDDKGLVWSHSKYKGFNQFDGKDTDVIIQALADITSDKNFNIAHSFFGLTSKMAVLAEVTVLSAENIQTKWQYDENSEVSYFNNYHHTLRIDRIHSMPTIIEPEQSWEPADGMELVIVANDDENYIELNKRYLMYIELHNNEVLGVPLVDSGCIAEIFDDRTIEPIFTTPEYYFWRVFDDFKGYTVEQMAELAENAKSWHLANSQGPTH